LSPLIPHLIFCCTLFTHTVKLEVHLIFQLVSEQAHSVERIYFLSVILISCDFYFFITPFIMNSSQFSNLIDSLRSEKTMLFNIIDTLENKLKESDDLLKISQVII
jgi:hypothetical protein